ncbi:MAG: hypothetical protein HYW81_00785 [Parcubacteria group bacterium]|nr:hypothetical protein [Parcubacteria group bacterium]
MRAFVPARSLSHPDVFVIEPAGEVITIDTIRAARSWLSLTPLVADKKVLVVSRAGSMTPESQNAFLKMLEEPAENTFIFLLASHRRQLLPTIYSRVIPLSCAPEEPEAPEAEPLLLVRSLLAAASASERMRLWLSAAIPKDEVRGWLSGALPLLGTELAARRSVALARAVRGLFSALGNPVGQNWPLAAERLIISW